MFTAQSARLWVVGYTLAITAGLMIFLALSQQIGMRFDFGRQENFRLIDVILPTFLGYLGACAHFIFNPNGGREIDPRNSGLLRMMVHAPFWIFAAFVISLFYVHYQTHLPQPPDAPRVDPLQFDTLSRFLSVALGVLAATIGIISSYLFGIPPKRMEDASIADTPATASTRGPNDT
ncbi:hypothetical protein NKI72_32200 [Mesorhizobium sp. M0437]|uniref:hypothetical protein n=1 Tax=Mesorhizobium sp. M0437 TaxID=2956945 RepID=UPI003336DFE6